MTPSPAEQPVRVLSAIFGLCGFVVAQPLFDVLGRGSTFFAAHQAGRTEIILFALLVVFLPAAVLGGLLLTAFRLAPRAWKAVLPLTLGLLTALAVVPHVDRAFRLSTWIFALSAVAVWFASSTAYRRFEGAKTFASATAFAPLLFAALFLFTSPVSTLVLPQASARAPAVSSSTNVVLVILDEFPLGALVDRAGQIDSRRFPGFGRLAAQSTWYRNAGAIAPWTYLAVPAILTGRTPFLDQPPVEAAYPKNLFRMLAASHVLRPHETITFLCGHQCDGDGLDRISMYRDAATVFLHGLLPDGLASRWLPHIGDQWKNFRRDQKLPEHPGSLQAWVEGAQGPAEYSDHALRYQNFLSSIRRPAGPLPELWVGHFLLPHFPLRHLPNGQRYGDDSVPPGLSPEDKLTWSDQRPLVELIRQRFMLQVKFVDSLIGDLLDRLSDNGMLDDTLLIVTADHGLSFAPGTSRRGTPLTQSSVPEAVPIPLFVKYPGESGGNIDDHPRQTLDIMPTIAEEMGIANGDAWPFEGRSLRGKSPLRQRRWLPEDGGIEPPLDIDLAKAASGYLEQFGEARADHDIYAFGPFAHLAGRRTDEVERATGGPRSPRVRLLTEGLDYFNPEAPIVPALVSFTVEWNDESPKAGWLAVAVNGTIGGLGPLYEQAGSNLAMAMVDPALLRPGSNRIETFVVAPDGRLIPTD